MTPNAIWLDGWDVQEVRRRSNETIVLASYAPAPEFCPRCGVVGRLYRHGTKTIDYRDTPAFGSQMTIRATVGRFRCQDCGATSMQPLPDMDARRRMTCRCVHHVEEQGIAQTYASVARQVGLDEKTVRLICEEHVERKLAARRIAAPGILGIDELTLGGRKRTIFVDVVKKELIDIIDAMNRGRVDQWLYKLPYKNRIKLVTIDMWGPYKLSVNAILPEAKIVVDKWHVVSKANDKLDRVRARYRQAAKGKERKNPHARRLLLQARGSNLSPMRRLVLDAYLAERPLIADAWNCKESFYSIWDESSRSLAEARYEAWKQSIPNSVRAEFGSLASTVDNWRDEIFNYFDHPFTNAYTEARNRLVKDLSRAGRGYSFPKIRAKAILSLPLTSKPLLVCESCLGVFSEERALGTNHYRHPETGERVKHVRMCHDCNWRFHTGDGVSRELNPTRYSG